MKKKKIEKKALQKHKNTIFVIGSTITEFLLMLDRFLDLNSLDWIEQTSRPGRWCCSQVLSFFIFITCGLDKRYPVKNMYIKFFSSGRRASVGFFLLLVLIYTGKLCRLVCVGVISETTHLIAKIISSIGCYITAQCCSLLFVWINICFMSKCIISLIEI